MPMFGAVGSQVHNGDGLAVRNNGMKDLLVGFLYICVCVREFVFWKNLL